MKKPKGLKKLDEKNKKNFELSKILMNASSFYDAYTIKSQNNDKETNTAFEGYELAVSLASEIAESATGYSHSSDVLDGPNQVFKDFAPSARVRYDESSDDYADESDFVVENRGDFYEEVKDTFRQKVDGAISSESLESFPSFAKLFALAKSNGFSGQESDFSKVLKSSREFREICKAATTNYTG